MSLESLFESGCILAAIVAAFALSSLAARLIDRRLTKSPPVEQATDRPSPPTTGIAARDGVEILVEEAGPTASNGPAAPMAPRAPVRWHTREVSRPRSAQGARNKT